MAHVAASLDDAADDGGGEGLADEVLKKSKARGGMVKLRLGGLGLGLESGFCGGYL